MRTTIRFATNDDLEACLQLSGACVSSHIWQLTQREQEEQIGISLNEIRLPRPMRVNYPRSPEEIIELWKSMSALLVAEERGTICGFLDLHAEPWHDIASIKNLVVGEPFRRRGIGSALVSASNQWARAQRLGALMTEAQSQNWPAITFYRKHGFTFCGFNDRYYPNQLAVFFTQRVR